jgi:homoserine kinase
MTAAKEGGASASYLSGGGSTVAAFVHGDAAERVGRLMTQAAISKGFSGRSIVTKPTAKGAHVV